MKAEDSTPPNEGVTLRELADGCVYCGMSEVYCHAVREMESRKCCTVCEHLGS